MRYLLFSLGLSATLAAPADAQVGFEPSTSPYKDLRIKQTVTALGGYLTGGRGKAGVGPSDGMLQGLRWDLHIGSSTLFLEGASMRLERNLIDPREPPETRDLGVADQTVYLASAGLNLILTGRKTWHGLAPSVGISMGATFGQNVPADSSGFRFQRKFQVGPSIGVRAFFGRRVHLRIEGRDLIWRLSYPNVFFAPPANDPAADPVLDSRITKPNEWVHHPMIFVGLGYTIRI